MGRTAELTIDEVRKLLHAMVHHGKTATVDWTNRSISVLTDPITHPTAKLSDGSPLTYRDYHYRGKW